MQQALDYLIRNNHTDAYKVLESLANIYKYKSEHAIKYGDMHLSLNQRKKASDCLVQALTIIENKGIREICVKIYAKAKSVLLRLIL